MMFVPLTVGAIPEPRLVSVKRTVPDVSATPRMLFRFPVTVQRAIYQYLGFVGSGTPGAFGPRFGFQINEKKSTVNLVCSFTGEAVSSLPKTQIGVKLGYPTIVPSGKTLLFVMSAPLETNLIVFPSPQTN